MTRYTATAKNLAGLLDYEPENEVSRAIEKALQDAEDAGRNRRSAPDSVRELVEAASRSIEHICAETEEERDSDQRSRDERLAIALAAVRKEFDL